jgi:RNA polymerase sigma-70 factor, ECF subfamily
VRTTQTIEQDETDLVQQAMEDIEAFAELYRRNLTRVYRYHVAHTGNPKDAEDLTSQTFIAALEGIRTFRGTGSFAAWIMGIASRKRLMFLRSRGNKPDIPLDAALHYPSPGLPTYTQPDLTIDQVELAYYVSNPYYQVNDPNYSQRSPYIRPV